MKRFKQTGHWCGFSPEWILRWVFNDEEVLKPFPQTKHTCGFSPVWVRMCLFNNEGLSKALLHTPHGKSVLSLGLALGVGVNLLSGRSPCELAAELSPDKDFPSSSADGGDPCKALDNSDIDRSNGNSSSIESIFCLYNVARILTKNNSSSSSSGM